MTTLSLETLEIIRSLRRITTSISEVSDRRRNQVRGMVRKVFMDVFGWTEASKPQELNEICINSLSSDGELGEFRLNYFRTNDEDSEVTTGDPLQATIRQKVKEIKKPQVSIGIKRKITEIYKGLKSTTTSSYLKKGLCQEIRDSGLITNFRPDYIDRYIQETDDCDGGEEEETDREDGDTDFHGNQTNPLFEKEVLKRLILTDPNSAAEGGRAKIVQGCIFHYDVVREAAFEVKEIAPWNIDERIQNHKLSDKWVSNFLQRNGLVRRKITTYRAPINKEEALKIIDNGQQRILQGQFNRKQIVNVDETAFEYELGPTHMYVPSDAERAAGVPGLHEKEKFTAAVGINSIGEFLPTMFILEHSREKDDETDMKVVTNLVIPNKGEFAGTWEKKVFTYQMETGEEKGIIKKCNYLVDSKGNIITSQENHRMDQVRWIMYSQLILRPYLESNGNKLAVWCDNQSAHNTEEVKHYWGKHGLTSLFLPANTTASLQPLDVGVNGSLKKHIRSWNGKRMHTEFKQFRQRYLVNPTTIFRVTPPSRAEGMTEFLKTLQCMMNTASFRQKMSNIFFNCGLVPNESGEFADLLINWPENLHGIIDLSD